MGYSNKTCPLADQPLFKLGRMVASAGVTELIENEDFPAGEYLFRHHHGDWGDVCEADKEANQQALLLGYRLVSKYRIEEPDREPVEIFIITEHDRSLTTIMLTREY
ncbi:MAG: hypothetical protein QM680_07320 [Luteolibacter sp.]